MVTIIIDSSSDGTVLYYLKRISATMQEHLART